MSTHVEPVDDPGEPVGDVDADEEVGLDALLDEVDPSSGDHEADVADLLAAQFGPGATLPESWEETPGGDEWPEDEDDTAAQDTAAAVAGADEFMCAGCFLIMHRRRLADPARRLCDECAGVSGGVR
ncbi:MAG TPA: DUF4193 family protein [Acidimicrobiales bacterium]|nr:DUF4193 family protein [Acidimicrobiales bacterium]